MFGTLNPRQGSSYLNRKRSVLPGEVVGYAYSQSSTVDTTTTGIPVDNTIPQNTEGQAYSSLDTTYRAKYANSLLEIDFFMPFISVSGSAYVSFALFRDSTTDAFATNGVSVTTNAVQNCRLRIILPARYKDISQSFKIRWGTNAATAYLLRTSGTAAFYGGTLLSTLTIREIAQAQT